MSGGRYKPSFHLMLVLSGVAVISLVAFSLYLATNPMNQNRQLAYAIHVLQQELNLANSQLIKANRTEPEAFEKNLFTHLDSAQPHINKIIDISSDLEADKVTALATAIKNGLDQLRPEIHRINISPDQKLTGLHDIEIQLISLHQQAGQLENDLLELVPEAPIQQLTIHALIMAATLLLLTIIYSYYRIHHRRERELMAQLEQSAKIDALTGITNRRHFDITIEHEWERARRSESAMSLVLCDIDFFKEYNDTLGHKAGDTCIRSVARALQQSLNRPGDTVSRYGGDEFAIILPLADNNGASLLMSRVQESIRKLNLPHPASSASDMVSISAGAATFHPHRLESITEAFTAADWALYRAKEEGRDRTVTICVEESNQIERMPETVAPQATEPLDHMLIGIVDDDPFIHIAITTAIEDIGRYKVVSFTSGLQAIEWCQDSRPDLLIVDFVMKGIDGIEFIKRFRSLPNGRNVPTMMITGDSNRETKHRALKAGANDFLYKPLDMSELVVRTKNMIELRRAKVQLANRARWLASEVEKATSELRKREREALVLLSKAAEYRDETTGDHISRMSHYARLICKNLGIDEHEQQLVFEAAAMHDVGKVATPDQILLKPGRLSPDELKIMREHTFSGYEILRQGSSELLKIAAEIAISHHEHFDGSGYPNGLKGTKIPLHGRIVAVADVFDALTSARPYKAAWSIEKAFEYLRESRGTKFDPACVDAFLRDTDEVLAIMRSISEHHDLQAG